MALNWKDIVKQILPAGMGEYSVRRNAYLRMGLPNRDASKMALSPATYLEIRNARLDLLPSEITANLRTCVDAGAHKGAWTRALLLVFRPESVVLIECEPRLVGELNSTIGKRPRTKVVDAALSAENGSAEFFQLRHPAGSSLLKPRPGIEKQFEQNTWDVVGQAQVKTISYDRLVESEEEVSVLKLDIQGAEAKVLRDSESGLKKTKAIIMEVTFLSHYDDDSTFPHLHELMKRKGFGLYRLSDAYHRGNGRAIYADAVYIREDILQILTAGGEL